jgi:hypothetical protein
MIQAKNPSAYAAPKDTFPHLTQSTQENGNAKELMSVVYKHSGQQVSAHTIFHPKNLISSQMCTTVMQITSVTAKYRNYLNYRENKTHLKEVRLAVTCPIKE